MEVDMQAERGGGEHGHKRADPEEPDSSVGVGVGDTKRPRDGVRLRSFEMEDEYDDEPPTNPLDGYRRYWIISYGAGGKSFEDETDRLPMPHTDKPVTEITGGLRWPLAVYGLLAVRDSWDRKRNILFRRTRDYCQTLTSLQDSLLELTGPSCAIVLLDEVVFEIDLKVKSDGPPSEDKDLSYNLFVYDNIPHRSKATYLITEMVPSDNSTMEFKFAHLAYAVEATISIRITSGSNDFSARFTARTNSIDEEMRRVAVVEEKGELILGVKATQGDTAPTVVNHVKIKPRQVLRSEDYIGLGFCRLYVLLLGQCFHSFELRISNRYILLNSTLVIPEIEATTRTKGISETFKSFSYLYDVDHFISALSNDVAIESQGLRCRVAFHALKFRPEIRALGNQIVGR
ncbi:hypothetical protein GUJ93_ZPchr0007g4198 [Zizania palustris]|uniref:DUF6598 domain-containing protein n=1 Tax=Zizania palustris TaxID=103762 RepID=A0A8J5TDT9_ZIZPA|nr:hypothetical protein GUJ93_ZPchr0007g4198 [Zizania palustris]